MKNITNTEHKYYYTTEFAIGDIVYLTTDPNKHARMITAIQLQEGGILYRLALGTNDSWQTSIEIQYDKPILNY